METYKFRSYIFRKDLDLRLPSQILNFQPRYFARSWYLQGLLVVMVEKVWAREKNYFDTQQEHGPLEKWAFMLFFLEMGNFDGTVWPNGNRWKNSFFTEYLEDPGL